jgi:cellulose biosynthesis protein BcsQ
VSEGKTVASAPATAIAHLKGGVGKTVVCVNLAHALVAELRRGGHPDARVLVVDCDPLSGATHLLAGPDVAPTISATVATVLAGQTELADTVLQLDDPATGLDTTRATAWAGIDLLPANPQSHGLRVSTGAGFWALRERLATVPTVLPNTRYILLDCGYGDTDLTDLALVAADDVLGVSTTARMSTANIEILRDKLQLMRRTFAHLHLRAVVANIRHAGHEADEACLSELRADLGEDLWEVLPARALVGRACHQQLPVAAVPGRGASDITRPLGRIAARLLEENTR